MSIMHSKSEGTCYLCKMLHDDYSRKYTEEHHVIYGTANRRLSTQFGLQVYLCKNHHTNGKEAVHNNAEIRNMLCIKAQDEFEKRYPELEWMKIFGKSWRTEETVAQGNIEGLGEFCYTEDLLNADDRF